MLPGVARLGNVRQKWPPVALILSATVAVVRRSDAWHSRRPSPTKPHFPNKFLNLKQTPSCSPAASFQSWPPTGCIGYLFIFCVPLQSLLSVLLCSQHKKCRRMWRTIRMVGSYLQNLGCLNRSPLRLTYTILIQEPCWEEPEEVGVRILSVFNKRILMYLLCISSSSTVWKAVTWRETCSVAYILWTVCYVMWFVAYFRKCIYLHGVCE